MVSTTCKICNHDICNPVVANPGYEDEHLVCSHFAEQTLHQCKICGDWFSSNNVIHTEEDTYFCTECYDE